MNRITIITINFNDAVGLEKTMESVFTQNTKNFDYILIDGGSKDSSLEIITKYKNQLFYWVSEKDTGIYNAMNKGVIQTKTEYVLFLNSGDLFYSNTILSSLNEAIEGKDFDLIYGQLHVLTLKPYIKTFPKKINYRFFLNDSLPFPCTLIKKELIVKTEFFDENLKIISDWKFFIKAFLSFPIKYYHLEKPLVSFNIDGISTKNPELIKKEKEKVLKEDFSFVNEDIQEGILMENKVKYLINSKLFKFLKKIGIINLIK